MNDLISFVKHLKVLIFANDVNLFWQVNFVTDYTLLQDNVCSVQIWCISNNLLFNPFKTQVNSLSKKHSTLLYAYCSENKTVSRTTLVKALGVFVDDYLFLFNCHTNSIVRQSLRTLEIMARLAGPFTTQYCTLKPFSTHVRSKLEFSSVVRKSTLNTARENIEHIQKRFVRIIYDRYLGQKYYFEYNLI